MGGDREIYATGNVTTPLRVWITDKPGSEFGIYEGIRNLETSYTDITRPAATKITAISVWNNYVTVHTDAGCTNLFGHNTTTDGYKSNQGPSAVAAGAPNQDCVKDDSDGYGSYYIGDDNQLYKDEAVRGSPFNKRYERRIDSPVSMLDKWNSRMETYADGDYRNVIYDRHRGLTYIWAKIETGQNACWCYNEATGGMTGPVTLFNPVYVTSVIMEPTGYTMQIGMSGDGTLYFDTGPNETMIPTTATRVTGLGFAPKGSVIVSGSGTAAVDGIYPASGDDFVKSPYTLEAVVDAMVVEGAGTGAANGVYLRDGASWGNPQFTLQGGTTSDDSIKFTFPRSWDIKNGGSVLYGVSSTSSTPEGLAWNNNDPFDTGVDPNPTTRRATLSDPGITADYVTWRIVDADSNVVYSNPTASLTPPLTGWVVGTGSSPAPTLSILGDLTAKSGFTVATKQTTVPADTYPAALFAERLDGDLYRKVFGHNTTPVGSSPYNASFSFLGDYSAWAMLDTGFIDLGDDTVEKTFREVRLSIDRGNPVSTHVLLVNDHGHHRVVSRDVLSSESQHVFRFTLRGRRVRIVALVGYFISRPITLRAFELRYLPGRARAR
jgi:hypothetical protein